MNLHAIPYIIPLILSGITLLILAGYLYKNDRSLNAKIFTFLLFFVSFWSFAYALQIFSDQYSWIVFWAKIKYFGIVLVPITWLLFSLLYAGKKGWVNKKNIILMSIIPCINLVFLFTNELHYLFWSGMGLVNIDNINFLYAPGGIFFWLNAVYSYILIVVGSVLIISMLTKLKHIYLRQAIALSIGVLTPLVGSIIYNTGLISMPIDYDITPMLFLVTGICLTFAIFRFRFLNIIHIAREQFFENVKDTVFIIDCQNKIVDLNENGRQFVKENYSHLQISDIVGKGVDEIFSDIKNYEEIFSNNTSDNIEILLDAGKKQACYDIQIISLYSKDKMYKGKMIVLRNITKRKNTENKLKEKIDELEKYKKVTVGRELKMIEMKKEMKELKQKSQEGK